MSVDLHLSHHGSPPNSLQMVPVPDETEEEDPDILDLSGQNLEKLTRAAPDCQLNTTTLILDDNLLQRLDNIHTYQCLEKLSVQSNQLIRMFQVAKLSHLKILNLAHNHVVTMEGLKELKLLTWLSLAANNIKAIEHLNQNVHLEHLDLSDNAITTVADISYLKNLKTCLLHKNRITTLQGCERSLPTALTALTLNDNEVLDLTDVSHLTALQSLEQLTFANNPAIEQPEDIRKQFDYRPYIINWCLGIQVLDGILVGAKESLKAEWMYSQSKGRQFTKGYHSDLLDYLVDTCPLHPDKDWQEDKKLNLILSKVQEHQLSLRQELPSSCLSNGMPHPGSCTLPRSFTTSAGNEGTPRRNSSSFEPSAGIASPRTPSRSVSATPTLQRRSFQSRSGSFRTSRTSPSPVRRATPLHNQNDPPKVYRVALPRTLYGDDINGNKSNGGTLMTQSMDPSQLGSTLVDSGPLRTAESVMSQSITDERLFRTTGGSTSSRPNSLFEHSDNEMQVQDLSENELGQAKLYHRLQNRLNPVPESLNSPDVPVPKGKNQRDDPMMLYNRDFTASFPSAQVQNPFQSLPLSASYHVSVQGNGGRGDSSSSDPDNNIVPPAKPVSKSKPKARPTRLLNRNSSSVGSGVMSGNNSPRPELRSTSMGPRGNMEVRKSHPPNRQVNDLKKNDDNVRKSQRSSSNRKVAQTSTAEDDSSHSESDNELVRQRNQKSMGRETTPKGSRPSSARNGKKTNGLRTGKGATGSGSDVEKKTPRYVADKYSSETRPEGPPTRSRPSNRPGSAPIKSATNSNHSVNRQRSNTLNMSNHHGSLNRKQTNSTGSGVMSKSQYYDRSTSVTSNPDPMTMSTSTASTVIQKTWKGHHTRHKDEKVQELKHEVRSMRTEEHVKYLTKELNQAKSALEQERKLRSLQMDAIKVLWKEVQMMDATKNNEKDRSRPSGSFGSKISSRSSEHSIAKLMETLEATAGNGSNSSNLLTPAKSTPSSEGLKSPKTPNMETIHKLNLTCNGLQTQVEQLQSSLNGVLKFMSAFSSNIERTRHSSSTSTTQDTASFQFYHTPSATAAPTSLPPSLFSSMVEPHHPGMYTSWDPHHMPNDDLEANQNTPTSSAVNNMSRSCDSLVQTDISGIVTPLVEEHKGQKGLRFQLGVVEEAKSNRPSSLPGLNDPKKVKSQKRSKIPGLKTLAGQVVLASPKAPPQVKVFAKNLVDEAMSETISKAISDSLQFQDDGTDISSSWAHDEDDTKSPPTPTHYEMSHSSMVETDSLEENNSPKMVKAKARQK